MLEATLNLGEAPFLASLRRVDSAVTGFRGRILTLNQAFQGLDYMFSGLVGQLTQLKGALDLGGRMSDLSAATGASAGEMLILDRAMKNAGGGAESASGLVAKMQKALSGLNEDGASTSDTLKALGIDAAAMRKLPLLDQLAAVQRAFQAIEGREDRTNLAQKLFGKGGAQTLPFFMDPTALGAAKTQLGGLVGNIDRNASSFDRLSDSLGALEIKGQQFYAGFADGFSGGMNSAADAIDKLDLTGMGKSLGQVASSLVTVAASLKTLQPLFVAIAGQMLVTRLAATNMGVALTMALRNPSVALAGLAIKMNLSFTTLRGAMLALPAIAARSMAGMVAAVRVGAAAIYSALGPVGWALLLGEGARGAIAGRADRMDAATASVRGISGDSKTQSDGFKDRIRSLGSEKDRSSVLADIDAATKAATDGLREAASQFKGDELARVQAAFGDTINNLNNWKRIAGGAALNPAAKSPFALTEKSPVSALGRIGGTANGFSSDPMLGESRRQTRLLEQIAANGRPSSQPQAPVPVPV